MLTEICAELRNYFCMKGDKIFGDFSVTNGEIVPSFNILNNQYYRIIGSVFNDGVHKFGDLEDVLTDEPEFHGAIWIMRVPKDVIDLAQEISEWQEKYGGVDSINMSPFSSESLGSYSYTKSSGYNANGENGSGTVSWKTTFASRLAPYRRIRV